MSPEDTKQLAFTEFVADCELRLRQALMASFGPDVGREAAAEALAYGWEHWDRIYPMENPVGYLFRVGQNSARCMKKAPTPLLPPVADQHLPCVEPGLPSAMLKLPLKQRQVLLLLHGYQWSMSEVADLMDISKATVQSYADRGLKKLRRSMKVNR